MLTIVNILAGLLCVAVALRLLMYRRNGSRYRFAVAFAAWLLINAGLVYGIWLVLCGHSSLALALITLFFALVLAIETFKARGNLAQVIQRPS